MSDETILCPECGWTGEPAQLDDESEGESDSGGCPVCSTDIEFVD